MRPAVFAAFFLTIVCGICHTSKLSMNVHTLKSSNINITEVPWLVYLTYHDSYVCSGTLIALDWVVTAAHCTDGISAKTLSIRAGTSILSSEGQVANVSRVYIHPNYNINTMDYDISILQLSAPFTQDSFVAPIPLPSSGTNWSSGTSGFIVAKSPVPPNLVAITVKIISQTDCSAAYGVISTITGHMLCVTVSNGGVCQGDSGGPLIVNSTLVGIASWGAGCSRGYPDVYANVASVRTYIQEIVGI